MSFLFYYYYLFYNNILNDDDPRITTVLAFSFSESLVINGVLDIAFANWFCWTMTRYYMIGILVVIILSNFFYFFTSAKTKTILKSKPKINNSHGISVLVAWLFFILTTSILFWVGNCVNAIISQCHPR
jgi:hypothetical protein